MQPNKQINKPNVYMDGSNYLQQFLPKKSQQWVFKDIKNKIEQFVNDICEKYNLIVLFDHSRKTEEAIKQWKIRKEAKFQKEIIDYPQNFEEFVFQIFKQLQKQENYKNKLKVYYCLEDADDTIASLAYINMKQQTNKKQQNIILSRDNDFFRYQSQNGKYNFYEQNRNKYPYKIYKSIFYHKKYQKYLLYENQSQNQNMIITRIENNQILVEKETQEDQQFYIDKVKQVDIKNLKESLNDLNICDNKSKFDLQLEEWNKLKEQSHRYVGIGTDLIKRFGNPLYELRQLIAQLLHKQGINFPIKHTFLIKDNDGNPIWRDISITPDKNDNLLKDPMQVAKDLNLFQKITPDLDEQEALNLIKHNVCIYSIVIGFIEIRDSSDLTQKLIDINTEERFNKYLEQHKQYLKQQKQQEKKEQEKEKEVDQNQNKKNDEEQQQKQDLKQEDGEKN